MDETEMRRFAEFITTALCGAGEAALVASPRSHSPPGDKIPHYEIRIGRADVKYWQAD
jgi:hypothetical protein